jgi:hypothetical protein
LVTFIINEKTARKATEDVANVIIFHEIEEAMAEYSTLGKEHVT